MLMTEWNWDDALAVRYEEGIEIGERRGVGKGRNERDLELIALWKSGMPPEEIFRNMETGRA